MSKENEVKVLDHEYDGIQELDNPLPGWWLATFYGAVIFAVLYVGYFHLGGPGKSTEEALNQDLEEIAARESAAIKNRPGPTEESLALVLLDKGRLEQGHQIFIGKCAVCHGPDGGGQIGPNLADKFWIHGKGALLDIEKVVSDGVADKGMPPWHNLMKTEELESVVAYVKNLKGTNPANPKAPQGTEVVD